MSKELHNRDREGCKEKGRVISMLMKVNRRIFSLEKLGMLIDSDLFSRLHCVFE
jgi:hypothetical protein